MTDETPPIDAEQLANHPNLLIEALREYAKDDRDGYSRGVMNPVNEKYQRLEDLSDDGYCRRFLELLTFISNPDTVNLSDSPVLAFDLDRWDAEERDDTLLLTKRAAESRFDEMVLEP